ncbi:SMC family ATPase [Microbacterium xanthum]|uniref:SMC family ATPase n=1 Tax=Microbacterium xanthum TaxID=3079794 RepID=UPI002AD50E3A|nr:SMC family ATPase [Microbacterium sp. KSW-48]MDZ8171709.1 SMC family ATPase [Microbacterium sp. KSW-48]
MRLHRLELEGFGPFRDRQVVDFDAYENDGIFLITGRTGAGKSSVLDGVCFALYGSAPRYEGTEKRLRSDHCAPDDPTTVSVEFTVGDRRWKVTRSPEYQRRKKRGDGFTTLAPDAHLDEFVDGEWIGRQRGPRNVALELDEIVGLSQQQFLQVILLAQNRFAEFLLAKNDERQRLLRTLFGTKTYEDYQDALEQRRKDGERALSTALASAGVLLDEAERVAGDVWRDEADDGPDAEETTDPVARSARAARAQARLDYRADALLRERDAADAAHRAAETTHAARRELRARHEARARSRRALAELEARNGDIDLARRRRDRAVAAESVRAPIDALDAAVRDAEVAAAVRSDALQRWQALEGQVLDDAGLAATIEQYTGEIAVAERALEDEAAATEFRRRLDTARARIAEVDDLLAALDAGRAELPVRLAQLDAELAAATEAAGAREARAEQRATLADRLAAARLLDRRTSDLRAAEVAHLDAVGRLEAAAAAVRDLLRRRLDGHAGQLAAELTHGTPCAVCGSPEHPAPAVLSAEPVRDEDIAAAEGEQARAAEAERIAGAAAAESRTAVAELRGVVGSETEESLTTELERVDADLRRAAEAVSRRAELSDQRRALVDADAQAAAERDLLAADAAAQRQAVAVAEESLAQARERVEAARGNHDSVAARLEAARARRTAAEALQTASRDHEVCERARIAAVGDLAERLRESGFDTVDDARDALLPAAERQILDATIADHEVLLRTERDRLRDLELELAGVGDEPVDIEETTAEAARARERWSAAVDAAAAASERRTRLADLRDRAEQTLSDTGELAREQAVIARLANTVAGRAPNTHRMSLESFVLAAELEEIVEAANLRLADMSSGRYALRHSDAVAARGASSGLGLTVLDAHTGQARPAQSLSGGETFLASLALALGLAEVVTARAGGVRLDTLFIDEGFGSLDADTLDLAMRTLDELRQGGRTVGLISHVAAMKEQIPAQLVVEATPEGPSTLRRGVASMA